MCAIFGLIDYNHTLNAKQREKVLRVLSQECEERGTDATGFAYNSRGKLTIYKLLFTLISALAQFERDVLADRTREGLAAARARGRKGGRRPVDQEAVRKAIKLYKTKQYTVSEITELTGVRKTTLYKNLQE